MMHHHASLRPASRPAERRILRRASQPMMQAASDASPPVPISESAARSASLKLSGAQ